MLGVFIFYIRIYILGKDFNVKYFNKNLSKSSLSEFKDLNYKEIELFLDINYLENNDCRIHLFFNKNINNNDIYDESNITKCNENLDIDPNGYLYCFNYSLLGGLELGFSGNCSDEYGNPNDITVEILTTNYEINHKSKNPFQKSERNIDNLISYDFLYFLSKKTYYRNLAQFSLVSYKSDNIFSKNTDTFLELYLKDIKTITYSELNNTVINDKAIHRIYSLYFTEELDYDAYEREYISLLDTLSKIGGLFSPIKLAFSILIQFYSGYEVNYQIVKNLILKKNIYKNNLNNNNNKIKIDKSLELNVEKALNKKKNNINSCLHFFGTIFKCCCQKRKTLRILNKCNEFITEHMSAEHLIFNSILFEKYYEDNPIRNIENIEGLKEIEEELYNYNCEDKKELLNVNEFT